MGFQPLIFELPGLDESHFTRIRQSQNRLKKRATSVGQRSSKLEAAVAKIKNYINGFESVDVASQITSPLEAKAFSKLFSHNEMATCPILSEETLRAIDSVEPVIKRQTLMMLIEGYLYRYDEGLDHETLDRLGGFIQRKLSIFGSDTRRSNLSLLARNSDRIFTQSSPKLIVSWAQNGSFELEDAFSRLGLEAYCDGRYFLVCRYLYYLEELKAIPLGKHHKILDEVSNRSVYMAPGKDMPCMGHDIISILIDRTKGSALSDDWMRVILDIAGDPRVPENSSNYQKWWSYLGLERIGLMRGWLSRLDLKLFLKVLNDYGKSSGDTDLQRMYPSRKRFLEGLIDQGLVTNSRLFINPRAEMFLRRGYKKEDLPEYAQVKDSRRSMIYLQVGDLHMIEGSHSFKLWIFPKLPEASCLLTYQRTQFSPSDLSSNLEWLYLKEFGSNAPRPADIMHAPANYSWQHRAITYLKNSGVKLDVEKLFSKQDYVKYIRLKGL